MTDFKQDHPDGLIITMDEMSLYLQATTSRVWFPVGQRPLVTVLDAAGLSAWVGWAVPE